MSPHNPATREVIPEQYQNTVAGEPFLTYDSRVGDEERMFIFASETEFQLLRESEYWYADGAFKTCPEISYQLYHVHGQQNGKILPNKTQAFYRRMLQQVFDHVGDNRLQDVLVNFERSAINVFHLIDENIGMKGCVYHLSSNIWKNVQHFGLQERYNEDQEFALHTHMLCAVVFMPPDNIIAGFQKFFDLIGDNYQGEMDDLFDYFKGTYIGRYRRNNERWPPLFALNWWNMFHRTFDQLEEVTVILKDGNGVFKRKYRRVILSFGSSLIFFKLKKT